MYELAGRFLLPDVYVHYILPRLRGDPDVVQFGTDTPMRVAVLEVRYSIPYHVPGPDSNPTLHCAELHDTTLHCSRPAAGRSCGWLTLILTLKLSLNMSLTPRI